MKQKKLLLHGREKLNPMANRTGQDKHLTVHVVSHSHDDVGWGKTVD